MKNRFIGTNIRNLIDILDFVEREQIAVDFEKCFNIVETRALIGPMEYFNIGDDFYSWILICRKF